MRCYGEMERAFLRAIFRSGGGRLGLLVELRSTYRKLQTAGTAHTHRACQWEMFG